MKAKKEQEEKERKEKEEQKRCIEVFENLPEEEQEAILDEIENQIPFFMSSLFKKERQKNNKPYKKPPYNFALVNIIQGKNL